MNFKIRKARASEATSLSDLALRSKAHWGYSKEFIESCREELSFSEADIAQNHFYVLEDVQSIVGFYALIQLSDETIELEALFVEPNLIGKGWGKELINHAKLTAKELGVREMLIQGDPNAKQFYEGVGGLLIGEKESGSIPERYLPIFKILIS